MRNVEEKLFQHENVQSYIILYHFFAQCMQETRELLMMCI